MYSCYSEERDPLVFATTAPTTILGNSKVESCLFLLLNLHIFKGKTIKKKQVGKKVIHEIQLKPLGTADLAFATSINSL